MSTVTGTVIDSTVYTIKAVVNMRYPRPCGFSNGGIEKLCSVIADIAEKEESPCSLIKKHAEAISELSDRDLLGKVPFLQEHLIDCPSCAAVVAFV